MDTEIRKRLEEAEKKYHFRSQDKIYRDGVEFGYKEAIYVAKEWIRDRNRHACQEWLDKECADFETDMNKLWEEEK